VIENKLHTALTGQSTHEDLVKKSGQRRILFDKSQACLRRILFHQQQSKDLRAGATSSLPLSSLPFLFPSAEDTLSR